jgi:hypothetical protein
MMTGEIVQGEVLEPDGSPSLDADTLAEQALEHFRPNNGKWKNFNEMTPAEREEMSRRGIEAKRRKRLARKLAETEAYRQAMREHASVILGTNLALYDSIVQKAMAGGSFNHENLTAGEIETLLKLGKQLEEGGHGKVSSKTETVTTVNVNHIVADLKRGLTS